MDETSIAASASSTFRSILCNTWQVADMELSTVADPAKDHHEPIRWRLCTRSPQAPEQIWLPRGPSGRSRWLLPSCGPCTITQCIGRRLGHVHDFNLSEGKRGRSFHSKVADMDMSTLEALGVSALTGPLSLCRGGCCVVCPPLRFGRDFLLTPKIAPRRSDHPVRPVYLSTHLVSLRLVLHPQSSCGY